MAEYLIGAGGWWYFNIPGKDALEAYAKIFNFVEVNSTYYFIPPKEMVRSWKRRVPPGFDFSVRLNRIATHKFGMEPTSEVFRIFDYTKEICRILGSEIIVIETSKDMRYDHQKVCAIKDLLSSLTLEKTRIAWEIRSEKELPKTFINLMTEYNVIHCVDLSREEPAYESDQMYTRLFGKGKHNIYQFSDEELREIDNKIKGGAHKKVRVSFHGIKMYKDASRYKFFKEEKTFPPFTKYTGLLSLRSVPEEDAKFPLTKQELIESQGWKIIDITNEKRCHATDLLKQLPERMYLNVNEVIREIRD